PSRLRLQLPAGPGVQQHLFHRARGDSRVGSGAGHGAGRERGAGAHLRRRTHGPVRGRPQRDQQAIPWQSHTVLPDPPPAARRRRARELARPCPRVAERHAGPPGPAPGAGSGRHRGLARSYRRQDGRLAAVGRTLCSMTVRGVSREAAIADYGVVLTGEPDEDLVSYDAAATDAARATRPALAEVFFDRGPGYARLCGGVSYADVDAVGS